LLPNFVWKIIFHVKVNPLKLEQPEHIPLVLPSSLIVEASRSSGRLVIMGHPIKQTVIATLYVTYNIHTIVSQGRYTGLPTKVETAKTT